MANNNPKHFIDNIPIDKYSLVSEDYFFRVFNHKIASNYNVDKKENKREERSFKINQPKETNGHFCILFSPNID